MATLYPDPDIVAKAVARLTDLYRNKPHVRALLTTLASRLATEDAIECELYTAQWISTAHGALLNAIGELVGEPRLGRSDDLYRLWIQARVRINRTHGTIADSYHLIRLIAGQNVDITYIPSPPAAYTIQVNGGNVDPAEMYKLLDAVRPAGVLMDLLYTPDDDLSNLFAWSDTDDLITGDLTIGFSNTAQLVGGRLRGVV